MQSANITNILYRQWQMRLGWQKTWNPRLPYNQVHVNVGSTKSHSLKKNKTDYLFLLSISISVFFVLGFLPIGLGRPVSLKNAAEPKCPSLLSFWLGLQTSYKYKIKTKYFSPLVCDTSIFSSDVSFICTKNQGLTGLSMWHPLCWSSLICFSELPVFLV